jgi:formamidopyrimidine-DNA glycosylase
VPELPEVETIRAGLARHVLDATVDDVDIRRDSTLRRQDGGRAEFTDRLRGRRFTAAVRRGKFLWLTLSGADEAAAALVIHLGMSGQLRLGSPSSSHSRIRFDLSFPDGKTEVLDFVDQRTFGYVAVRDLVATVDGLPGGLGSDRPQVPDLAAHIARDLLDPHLDRTDLVRRIRTRQTGIKRALLDQKLVSGIGNIYADEALWRAGLHYAKDAHRLRPADVNRLLDHARDVLNESLAAGGTTFDNLYVNVDGDAGYFARALAVYGRTGANCPRCDTPIVREAFMNRSSFRCPRCQRPPRTRR